MSAAEIKPGRAYACRLPEDKNAYTRLVLEVNGNEVTLIRGWFTNVGTGDGPNDPWTLSPSGPVKVLRADITEIGNELKPTPVPGSPRRNYPWAPSRDKAAAALEASNNNEMRNGVSSRNDHDSPWTLGFGEKILRSKLHDNYGGNRQRGIAPSSQHPHTFVFTDSSSGDRYGYLDRWDGRVLYYFGEGQRGDMTMTGGNLALLEHESRGKALRLFEGASGTVEYVGEYRVSGEPERVTAPDTAGSLREAIVFRLVPVNAAPEMAFGASIDAISRPYREVNEDAKSKPARPSIPDPDAIDRAANSHGRLQNLLSRYMREGGANIHEPERWPPGLPQFDLLWDLKGELTVAEVKSMMPSNETIQLRLGLGQVLHYQAMLERLGNPAKAVLFVEQEPTSDGWVELCAAHGVQLLWPSALAETTQS